MSNSTFVSAATHVFGISEDSATSIESYVQSKLTDIGFHSNNTEDSSAESIQRDAEKMIGKLALIEIGKFVVKGLAVGAAIWFAAEIAEFIITPIVIEIAFFAIAAVALIMTFQAMRDFCLQASEKLSNSFNNAVAPAN